MGVCLFFVRANMTVSHYLINTCDDLSGGGVEVLENLGGAAGLAVFVEPMRWCKLCTYVQYSVKGVDGRHAAWAAKTVLVRLAADERG
jgi:hypothetical protein